MLKVALSNVEWATVAALGLARRTFSEGGCIFYEVMKAHRSLSCPERAKRVERVVLLESSS